MTSLTIASLLGATFAPWLAIALVAVGTATVGAWLLRERRVTARRMRALLQRADCMVWEADVRGPDEPRQWTFTAQPSGLFTRLFADLPAANPGDLWPKLDRLDREKMDATSRQALASGAPGYQQEFRVRKGSDMLWLQEIVTITRLGPDRWHLVGVVTDVTAWRSAVQSMQTKEEQAHQILARADCLLWRATVTREEGDTLRWGSFQMPTSGLYPRLFGERDPNVGSKLWSFIKVPALAEMNARSRAAILAGRTGYEQEFCAITPLETIWLREKVSLRPAGENVFNLVGVLIDVTAQHLAEAELAAEKERLAVTLRAMADAVITTDTAGIVQFANQAAARLLAVEAEAIAGRPVTELVSLESADSAESHSLPVARVAQDDAVVELPGRTALRLHDGATRLVEGCCAPIHGHNREVIGTVLVLRNITEREQLEHQLARASKLESVGVLAGGIAHDFNNILTVILGNLNLALYTITDRTDADRALHEAEQATLHARDLTQQLLTFAKGGDPVRTAVHLPEILRQTAEFTVRGSRTKCAFELGNDLWAVHADKGQLAQVVQNLVLNAVQAMPTGGITRIAARNIPTGSSALPVGAAVGNYVQLTVTDTGVGIASEHLARVFDPYFTTKHQGSGLGLATVYSIVTKHQGLIDVSSKLGAGTTFNIWLPAMRDAPVAAAPAREPAEEGFEGRVLVMDDEPAILRMAGLLLRKLGFTVVEAADGREAVAQFTAAHERGEPFDLVITDLTVPGGMGGEEAMLAMRALDPKVKAIVSSGYSSDPVLANFRDYGFSGRIAKPYQIVDFVRVVRQVLERR